MNFEWKKLPKVPRSQYHSVEELAASSLPSGDVSFQGRGKTEPGSLESVWEEREDMNHGLVVRDEDGEEMKVLSNSRFGEGDDGGLLTIYGDSTIVNTCRDGKQFQHGGKTNRNEDILDRVASEASSEEREGFRCSNDEDMVQIRKRKRKQEIPLHRACNDDNSFDHCCDYDDELLESADDDDDKEDKEETGSRNQNFKIGSRETGNPSNLTESRIQQLIGNRNQSMTGSYTRKLRDGRYSTNYKSGVEFHARQSTSVHSDESQTRCSTAGIHLEDSGSPDQQTGSTPAQLINSVSDRHIGIASNQHIGSTFDQNIGSPLNHIVGSTSYQHISSTFLDQNVGSTSYQHISSTLLDQNLGSTSYQHIGSTLDQTTGSTLYHFANVTSRSVSGRLSGWGAQGEDRVVDHGQMEPTLNVAHFRGLAYLTDLDRIAQVIKLEIAAGMDTMVRTTLESIVSRRFGVEFKSDRLENKHRRAGHHRGENRMPDPHGAHERMGVNVSLLSSAEIRLSTDGFTEPAETAYGGREPVDLRCKKKDRIKCKGQKMATESISGKLDTTGSTVPSEHLLHFLLYALLASMATSILTPLHLRKAKLMFFYVRYPNSVLLRHFYPDVEFNKNNMAQMIKWFSNFREFYYIQTERFARQMACQSSEQSTNLDTLIDEGSDLYKTLKAHYSKNDQNVVPDKFRIVVQTTVSEFVASIQSGKDRTDPSWKKSIYKLIARLDDRPPDEFKSVEWMRSLGLSLI